MTIQEFTSKLLSAAIKVFREVGASDKDIKDAFNKAKNKMRELDFEDNDRVEEILKAVDQENKKLSSATDTDISLTKEEKLILNGILENAFNNSVADANKVFSKSDLDDLQESIESIKDKLR